MNKIATHLGGSSFGCWLGSSRPFPAGLSSDSCFVRSSNAISNFPCRKTKIQVKWQNIYLWEVFSSDEYTKLYRAFSHDVTVAKLVFQKYKIAAMLVFQTNPVGVELFSYANAFFCSNKFAYMLATWVKTLYIMLYMYWSQTKESEKIG